MMQPVIAHVITESTPFGGAQRNTLLTLKGLIQDGYQAELVCGPGGPLIREAEAAKVRVHVIDELIRPVDPAKDFRALFKLYKLFKSQKYDLVHTHSTKAGLLGRSAAWWAGIPSIVHTVHGVPFEMNGSYRSRLYIRVERLIGSLTHCVICVGDVLGQELEAWKMVPREKLRTIYSGIDFADYVSRRTASQTKQELGLEDAWPIIGCIGRLSEQKAQHYLVEAIKYLVRKYPQIKLILVGDGELRPQLERQVCQHGLLSHVLLLGERDDIADLLSIFDVYAMSSLWEGVGRALTEAMYWGLPIVATPVNGVKELIHHEVTGLLTPPRDPDALATSIHRLVADVDLAQHLGSNARRRAEELMGGDRMVKAIEEVYASLRRRKAFQADGNRIQGLPTQGGNREGSERGPNKSESTLLG
jgi:glycosyltransferase involved in cell wall biosynthesis